MSDLDVVNAFRSLYYSRPERTWLNTYWLGVRAAKFPTDLWVYQEILYELRPELIIETGTYEGGSALFLASICDLLGHGEVLSIDLEERRDLPSHPRIRYLQGRSSTNPDVVSFVREQARDRSPVLVILDSDHQKHHVLAELRAYGDLVTRGSYLICEDTMVNHDQITPLGPGPMEALAEFLQEQDSFTIDQDREKLMLTQNPRGYLRRDR